MIEKECECCGKTFQADTRELNRGNAKFCSRSCGAKMSRELNHKLVCKHCGKEFMSASKNAKYCSDSCKQKNYRTKQKSQSEDGKSLKHYYTVFEKIPCEICQWDKTSRDLHHILEVANGGTNELDNLICVCPNCHREIHNNLISKDDLFKIVETRTI